MIRILILDVYPNVSYRISKDQNGGYGTANDYGDSFLSKILKFIVKGSVDFPPLYSVQVCGELQKMGYDVKYKREENDYSSYDLVIMTSSIVCHESEIDKIKEIVRLNKKIIVIGPFASSNPKTYIDSGASVLKGEPEMFFHKFEIDQNFLNSIPKIIENKKSYNLDELNYPGWEIVFKNYVPKMKFLGKGPAVNIYASKGCPYQCFYYCVYPLQQGRKLRVKSPQKVIDEMLYFNEKLKVKNFIFRDPVFSLNKLHTVELCEKLISLKIKFNICIETHLKNIDNDLAKLLLKAGVKLIYVGIETSDEDVKKNVNRSSEKNDLQIDKVRFLQKIGIDIKAMYIIGLPSDTEQTYLNTLNFSKKISSTYAQFSVFTPYPGTPAFQNYKDKITTSKYEDFNQWKLVFKHDHFSQDKIRELLDFSYRDYYLRFNWIFKNFKKLLKLW
jgi:anaerobic magnesium-protoporphyrin IX monomethyl ester cyclase